MIMNVSAFEKYKEDVLFKEGLCEQNYIYLILHFS